MLVSEMKCGDIGLINHNVYGPTVIFRNKEPYDPLNSDFPTYTVLKSKNSRCIGDYFTKGNIIETYGIILYKVEVPGF